MPLPKRSASSGYIVVGAAVAVCNENKRGWFRAGYNSSNIYMKPKRCMDPVIGDILAGWRFDISGLSPEMRTDYEQHFVECSRCRSRQRFHRTVDVVLIDDKRFCFVVYSGTFIFLPISDDGHTIAANYVGCAQQQQHTPLFISDVLDQYE